VSPELDLIRTRPMGVGDAGRRRRFGSNEG
jgi:hypothetical protein